MEALAGLGRGAKIFYRKDATTWQQGELVSVSNEGTATIQVAAATLTVAADLVVPANPVLQDGIPDVVQLSYLNEPGILYNLGHRYNLDHIYTWAGPVLIALNPCKPLPLYTPEVAAEYKLAARESVTTLAPHIYMVAAAAFRQMLRNKCSQSLVVSGESGAGKTETTKKAMQYFATLAGGTGVEDQVLETNPILEAFGNAKTLRNHNSSRFGKLIQIHFNGSHHICGATIKTYLLEKSRVAMQLKGERSFHIFYQLVRGVTEEEREAFRLPRQPQDFHFLSQSGCIDIAGVDDAAEFRLVRRALCDVGVDEASQVVLFKMLSGLLWLGNIEFEESGTGDSTKVRQNPALSHAAALLGWSPEALITALTTRRIVAPGEVVIKLLKVSDAIEARNSLAKAIYSAIFNWVVARINTRLSSGKVTSGLYIAILDIYGFEQFDRNSFEQLCINYANERLQQQFTHHLFKLEQVEYESEDVDWTKVEFIDNQDCVDVFELMPPKGLGMLAVMDSQCKFPRATDSTLHVQLVEALGSRSHFGTNPRVPGSFVIKHYAGSVQYDTYGLLDKNKDTLSMDLIQLMASSSKALMAELGAAVQEEADRSSKKGQTVISRFGQQLRELVSELDTTGLHFVRCIKPNAQLVPSCLDAVATLHQLRCCGVLEVARVSAAGFPTRYRLEDFASRYSLLLSPDEQRALQRQHGSSGSRQICMALLERFGLQTGQYQIGRTKVFFRPGVLGLVEDRWARMQAAVLAVQAWWRMYRCRVEYLRQRNAASVMQGLWRCRVAQLAFRELAARHAAAVVFQSAWRMHVARTYFLRVRWAVITIQKKGYRMWKFSRWLSKVLQARDRAELAAEEDRVRSKLEADWFGALRAEYSVSMEDVPTALAAWRSCRDAGADTLEAVEDALAAWRTSREGPAAGLAPAATTGTATTTATTCTAASSRAPSQSGEVPAASQQQPQQAGPGAGAASAGGAASHRPPVMIMTSAVVTPAVVNRFELAQELAIQVERLNLENVKLQKQLALERSLTQRYQHKCEEQSGNWLEQVRLLQAYIQKCRTMFGDSQLPPLPKQVAAATQPPEAAAADGAIAAVVGAPQPPDGGITPPPSAAASPALAPPSAGHHYLPDHHPNHVGAEPPLNARSGSDAVAPAAAAATALSQPNGMSRSAPAADSVVPLVPLAAMPPAAVSSATTATQTDGELAPPPPPPPLPPAPEVVSTAAGTEPPIMITVATETDPTPARMSADGVVGAVPPLIVGAAAAASVAAADAAAADAAAADAADSVVSTPPRPVSAFVNPVAAEHLHSSSQSIVSPPSSVGGLFTPSAGGATVDSRPHGGTAGGQSNGTSTGGGQSNASQRYVSKLGEELDRVMQVLPDDVAFIREVQEGQVVAPEMDPGVELFKLKKKFDVWKREFKEKLRTTEEVLRKIELMEGRSAVSAAPHNPQDPLRPSQSHRVVAPLAAGAANAASRTASGSTTVSGGGAGAPVQARSGAGAATAVGSGSGGGSDRRGTSTSSGAAPGVVAAAATGDPGSGVRKPSKLLNKLFNTGGSTR